MKANSPVITKEQIRTLKHCGDMELTRLLSEQKDVGSINFILENLGTLPSNLDPTFLYNLLIHSHPQVRLNAVKKIGKLNDKSDASRLFICMKKRMIQT